MSVFAKKNYNSANDDKAEEIDKLLDQLDKKQRGGSSKNLIAEVNSLLSEIRGSQANHVSADAYSDLAMQGGAKKKAKKTKSKSKKSKISTKKAKKSAHKSKSSTKKSKSSAKKSKSSAKKSKSSAKPKKSKTSTKKKSKSMSRTESKQKGQYMKDSGELKAFIKQQLPKEDLNYIAMSKPVATMLKEHGDVAKAKKNFNAVAFMKEYNASVKSIEAKKAAKKAAKASRA